MKTRTKLFALVASLLFAIPSFAAQSITFTITPPPAYFDGTAFGTEQLVYMVYDKATDKQLFSTLVPVVTRTDIADGITCFYAKAGVYNVTNNSVIASTVSDASADSCTPTIPSKKVGVPGLSVKKN